MDSAGCLGGDGRIRLAGKGQPGTPQPRYRRLLVMKAAVPAGLAASAVVLAACSAAGGQPTLNSSAAPPAVVYDCAGNPQTRPASLTLACADAGITLSGVTWSAWSPRAARGAGRLGVNSCQPSCAAGTFGYSRVTIALSTPHGGQGRPYFTRLALSGTSVPASLHTWALTRRGPAA